MKNALISSAGRSGHLTGLVKADGHLNTLGAAHDLGLLSSAEYLMTTNTSLLQDCLNRSQDHKPQIFLISFLIGLLLVTSV